MSEIKAKTQNSGLFKRVYDVVRKIPKGKVMTYGQIAEILGTGDARKVGWALHANKDPKTPCHRVVSKDGKVALNFGAFLPSINRSSRRVRIEPRSREGRLGGDGWSEQKRRLLEEGIGFIGEAQVDLNKYLWEQK